MTAGMMMLRALLDSGDPGLARKLHECYFQEEEYPAYHFVRDHYVEHGTLPTLATVRENHIELPEADEPFEYYKERCKKRAVFEESQKLMRDLAEGLRDFNNVEGFPGRIQEAVARINEVETQSSYSTLAHESQDVLETFAESRVSLDTNGVTLGWPRLDDITNGLHPGDIGVVVGRPSMGKSYILLNMAKSAWEQGHSSLFVSMEMTVEQITRRWLGLLSGINPRFVQKGQLSPWATEIFRDSVSAVQDGVPVHFLSGDFKKTVEDVQEAARYFDPDVIYVDAAYLLGTRMAFKSNQARWEKTTEVIEGLKIMAATLNKPVVITVQFNRTVTTRTKKDLDLGSIAGADSIPQIASLVLGLKLGENPNQQTQRRMQIMKHREGEGDEEMTINYKFYPLDFSEVIDEDSEIKNTGWMV